MLQFKDLTHDVVVTRPARFVIVDRRTGAEYGAADATHGAQVLTSLIKKRVTPEMFYALRCKTGPDAGALRHRFDVRRANPPGRCLSAE